MAGVVMENHPFKEVGWNGIAFLAPRTWEIVELGTRYVVLADDDGVAMEVKWGQGRRGRSRKGTALERQFRKLTARFRRGGVIKTDLPGDWEAALSTFETMGFSWGGGNTGGRGAILRCPSCGNGILIQFHGGKNRGMEPVRRKILASLKDHAGEKQLPWAIYDIRFILPEGFVLKNHRFLPGHFEITFSGNSGRVTLYRWGPASVLLSGCDLRTFAEKAAGRSLPAPLTDLQAGGSSLTWEIPQKKRLFHLLRGQGKCPDLFRVWHHDGKNRILAVRSEGICRETVEEICSNYESVQ